MFTAGLILAALVAATPGGSRTVLEPPGPGQDPPGLQSSFSCQDGSGLVAHFLSKNAQLIAVVDVSDGTYALPLKPWDGGAARITWSDGVHTLTWNPGVQLMWMDGAVHRMCGRSGGHRH